MVVPLGVFIFPDEYPNERVCGACQSGKTSILNHKKIKGKECINVTKVIYMTTLSNIKVNAQHRQ
jgi:hypothetical protein